MKKSAIGILFTVMKMKESKKMLESILETTQMGQIGIRSALDATMQPGLRAALESQLREYDTIEREAHAIAGSRGWVLNEIDPAIRGMANMMTKTRLRFGNTDSKLAAMMIQGNTKGMILGYKNRHKYRSADLQVVTLSQKLLDCETANIIQMQGYL